MNSGSSSKVFFFLNLFWEMLLLMRDYISILPINSELTAVSAQMTKSYRNSSI